MTFLWILGGDLWRNVAIGWPRLGYMIWNTQWTHDTSFMMCHRSHPTWRQCFFINSGRICMSWLWLFVLLRLRIALNLTHRQWAYAIKQKTGWSDWFKSSKPTCSKQNGSLFPVSRNSYPVTLIDWLLHTKIVMDALIGVWMGDEWIDEL